MWREQFLPRLPDILIKFSRNSLDFQLERFMPQEGAFVATLYAPIMFPPAPVLVFTQDKHTSKISSVVIVLTGLLKKWVNDLNITWMFYIFFTPDLIANLSSLGYHTLIGTGSLYRVNPDRIVSKKIVLSGHPFKINKRSVVLRYMFFNRG